MYLLYVHFIVLSTTFFVVFLQQHLAAPVGFEPTNVGIKIRCLNQLGEGATVYGKGDGIRTR